MTDPVSAQLSAIHSMLSAGHRNLRLERHTLVLWGLTAGGLLLVSESILTPRQIPSVESRALAWLALLAAMLSLVGGLDWTLTRRLKRARDESWSFIHRQVLKVWWLLMSLGVLLTFAMFFFGGGTMLCAAWIVLFGLGLYVHGLFSEELLEWIGGVAILMGVGALAAGLDYENSRRIATVLFGLGLPLLALLLDGGQQRPVWWRLLQTVGWMVAVLAVALAWQRLSQPAEPDPAGEVSLEDFLQGRTPPGLRRLTLPAGTPVPVRVEVSGDLFRHEQTVLPLTLDTPLDILLQDGRPTGALRLPQGFWLPAREATRRLSIPRLEAELTPAGGPEIEAALVVRLARHPPR